MIELPPAAWRSRCCVFLRTSRLTLATSILARPWRRRMRRAGGGRPPDLPSPSGAIAAAVEQVATVSVDT